MRRHTILSALILTFVLVFSLGSCSVLETEQGNVIKAYCEDILDAILADDPETAYAVLADEANKENFLVAFGAMREYISGVETYQLVQKGWYTEIKNGISYYEATFEMTTNADTYYVIGRTVEGYERLFSFNISAESESDFVYTGTITTLSGTNPLQWAVLLVAAALFIFTIIMLIDCCKRKIKLKPMWIILILAGVFVFSITYGEGDLSFNTSIGLLFVHYSHLKLYPTGNFDFQLVLPAAAIVYFILRKRMTIEATVAEQPPIDIIPEIPEEIPVTKEESDSQEEAEDNKTDTE